jgi:hypothetical protein
MCPALINASCEIRVVIRYIYTNSISMTAREIQHVLCARYGQIVIREGSVRGQAGEQMFTMMNEVVGRSLVVNNDLVQSVH